MGLNDQPIYITFTNPVIGISTTSGTSGMGTSGTSGNDGVGTNGTSGTSGTSSDGSSGTSGWGTSGTSGTSVNSVDYLALDQTTPQTVRNGRPIFDSGIVAHGQSDFDSIARYTPNTYFV